jgi:hypothetical protein
MPSPHPPSPQGRYHDRLLDPGGRVLADRGWRSNLIVDRARFLIAGFMRGDAPGGITLLRLGRGLAEWDGAPPPPPPRSTEQLQDGDPFEVALAPGDIEYLDAGGNPAAGPTQRLRIVVTLGAGEPAGPDPYPLREFGLFGSFGGEPYMINYVRHGVIHKPADATLERTIQLVF